VGDKPADETNCTGGDANATDLDEKDPPTALSTAILIADESSNQSQNPKRTIDWKHLKRVSLAQELLCAIALLCVAFTLLAGHATSNFLWARYSIGMTMWLLYLMITGSCGRKASTRKFGHLITYFVLTLFQTVLNAFWMGIAFFGMCYVMFTGRYPREYNGWDNDWQDALMVMEVVESVCVLGTVVTGIVGTVCCVKGLGRMLSYQEEAIQAQAGLQPMATRF